MREIAEKAELDWERLSSLRIRAKQVTDGLYAGTHRSKKRGTGIEFAGHRDYTPGDDLRHLDARALMRHGRLLVRQFETETERCLCLLVDGRASMAFKSDHAKVSKAEYAALLAAALGRVVAAGGDPLSLDWLGGNKPLPLPITGGRSAFERLVTALEESAVGEEQNLALVTLERSLLPIAHRARRGSTVVLLSDLVALPEGAETSFATLSGRERTAIAVQVLDPVEDSFPFEGAVRLRPAEAGPVVETDGASARQGYLQRLEQCRSAWQQALLGHRGRLITCTTADNPLEVIRRILSAIGGRPQ